jgi:DNA-binding CsgD family transcriptional regulator
MGASVDRGFSPSELDIIWRQWRLGHTLSDIGRELRKHPASVFHIVAANGGISPPPRHRNGHSLTLAEREEISRGIAGNYTIRQIADTLQRSPSTISREIGRNGGRLNYRACMADKRAWDFACRPKPRKLEKNTSLNAIVSEKLVLHWSPEHSGISMTRVGCSE